MSGIPGSLNGSLRYFAAGMILALSAILWSVWDLFSKMTVAEMLVVIPTLVGISALFAGAVVILEKFTRLVLSVKVFDMKFKHSVDDYLVIGSTVGGIVMTVILLIYDPTGLKIEPSSQVLLVCALVQIFYWSGYLPYLLTKRPERIGES